MIQLLFVCNIALCISDPESNIFHYFAALAALHSEVRTRSHTQDVSGPQNAHFQYDPQQLMIVIEMLL